MADIKDKIKKLLALATSPNENEAQAAMLKARQLMAKYKIEEYDLNILPKNNVIKELVGVSCTAMTNSWATELAALIAEHYCCTSYVSRTNRSKVRNIGFIGLEDDFSICKQIFLYAHKCVSQRCGDIRKENAKTRISSDIRELCNAYGYGFAQGLDAAFREQDMKHREYALVLVTSDLVMKKTNEMRSQFFDGNNGDNVFGSSKYSAQGYADGKRFNAATKPEG